MSLKLYEIPSEIDALIDPETGEITDAEKLTELVNRFNNGVEWLALEVKNSLAEADALKKEKDAFAQREKVASNRAKNLKNYLAYLLHGEKFKTDKVAISWRRSEQVQVDEENFLRWAKEHGAHAFLRWKEPEVDKTALKEAFKQGIEVPYAELVENQSIQIK